jgi:phospholipase C
MRTVRGFAIATALFMGAGCGGGLSSGVPVASSGGGVASSGFRAANTGPIQHVILIVQEHRSFDNLFAGYNGADAPLFGFDSEGVKVPLKRATFQQALPPDVARDTFASFVTAWNAGKMNGFDRLNPSDPTYPYSYVEREQTKPYWDLAEKYVLADHMFSESRSGGFVAHQYLVAGTAEVSPDVWLDGVPDMIPYGCDAPPGTTIAVTKGLPVFPCFTYRSMADPLDAAHVSWKTYTPGIGGDISAGLWNGFDAIKKVRLGPDWHKMSSPNTNIFRDIENSALPQISWVLPTAIESDDAAMQSAAGPKWVASIVDAVGKSSYWKHTAIIVLWDDSGLFYDDVPPPQLDATTLGFRVPAIIVSPYAKRGYVSHTVYEFGSVLKFIEQQFGLPSLGPDHVDARSNSIEDAFDFSKPARAYQ